MESEDVTIVEMLPFIDEGGEKLFVRATPGCRGKSAVATSRFMGRTTTPPIALHEVIAIDG
jgi:hypothetical protein